MGAVVLVPAVGSLDPGCEAALRALADRGVPVRRAAGAADPDAARNRLAADALADGLDPLVWVDPSVVFDPADVGRLVDHGRPFVCGLYPHADGRREIAAAFPAGTPEVRFGAGGGLVPVLRADLGFACVRAAVFAAVRAALGPAAGQTPVPYFAPATAAAGGAVYQLSSAEAFCERARRVGVELLADTTVRLWRVGPYRYGWEDAGPGLPRADDFVLRLAPADPDAPVRPPAAPLPPGFPRLRAYVAARADAPDDLARALAAFRASDWGDEPEVASAPADAPPGDGWAAAYRRALERAAAGGADFALVVRDDIRVARHLRHNLLTLPLVRRDACDRLALFAPDLLPDPWDREEPALGYRLERPAGPGAGDLWGGQADLLSRRLVLALLARWDGLAGDPAARVRAACRALGLPAWATAPCLADHHPDGDDTDPPDARAPDFDPDFRLEVGPGFHPPGGVPGDLTPAEGRALYEAAAGRVVLEVGFGAGRATACLGQSARFVAAVGAGSPAEAAEWVRRYGPAGRVEFIPAAPPGRWFGLVVIDGAGGRDDVRRAVGAAAAAVAPGGVVAVRGYPDPEKPAARREVDPVAGRLGWVRVRQADYLGLFRAPG